MGERRAGKAGLKLGCSWVSGAVLRMVEKDLFENEHDGNGHADGLAKISAILPSAY